MKKIDMSRIVEGAIVSAAGEGVWHILKERVRVMGDAETREHSLEHDDRHDQGELILAAIAYCKAADYVEGVRAAGITEDRVFPHGGHGWPWPGDGKWNPSPDPIRNLEKAGQLIAAEIDRLKRKQGQ